MRNSPVHNVSLRSFSGFIRNGGAYSLAPPYVRHLQAFSTIVAHDALSPDVMDMTPARAPYRNLILLWAGVAIVMAATVIWAATQVDDPLSRYVQTDKMRHILAFGAIGLCCGLMPTRLSRLIGLGAVLTFAMAVEIIQIPIPDRSASVSDLFASWVGAFAGFGLASAVHAAWSVVRGKPSPQTRD